MFHSKFILLFILLLKYTLAILGGFIGKKTFKKLIAVYYYYYYKKKPYVKSVHFSSLIVFLW